MSKRPGRAAIYARVSTDTQTVENQIRELKQIAVRRAGKWSRFTPMPASAAPKIVLSVLVSIGC
jgi:hypothetical protein